jgi:hypothetical protein
VLGEQSIAGSGGGFAVLGKERGNREKRNKNERWIRVAVVCFQSVESVFDYVSLAIDLGGRERPVMSQGRTAGRSRRQASREQRRGPGESAAASPGGGANSAIVSAISYSSFRLAYE